MINFVMPDGFPIKYFGINASDCEFNENIVYIDTPVDRRIAREVADLRSVDERGG